MGDLREQGLKFWGWFPGVDDGPGRFVDSAWSYTCRFNLRGEDSCILPSSSSWCAREEASVVREGGYVRIYVGRGFRGQQGHS